MLSHFNNSFETFLIVMRTRRGWQNFGTKTAQPIRCSVHFASETGFLPFWKIRENWKTISNSKLLREIQGKLGKFVF